MATVKVVNTNSNRNASRRSRYEKMEVAFGKILTTDYVVGDTLSFTQIPAKEIIRATFLGNGVEKVAYYGADFAALTLDLANSGADADINYVIEYIKGTGKIDDGTTQKGEGVLVKLTVSSS